ncbi:protein NO VEIN domain-containing protein [Bacillus sp. T3]|uniref:protein NO VEIN domain-containing protein n=1 Tax=Bacillus sp. T3 TaxID=467262 RepID=UPI002981E77B|nr:DUF3883 domain-containing protein [Bacillus sp. T3]
MGEVATYYYLKTQYRNRHSELRLLENNTGFELYKNNMMIIRVTWNNLQNESYLPYDFVIEENNSIKYIEVKSTPSDNKSQVDFSRKEWDWMFKNMENYCIYRIFNVGKKNVRIEIIDSPADLIIKGEIFLDQIKLLI